MTSFGEWEKASQVYSPDNRVPWVKSHAQIPTARCFDDNSLQVLFGARDELGRSLIGSMTLSGSNPSNIIDVNPDPILSFGAPGSFDDRGLMPSSLVDFKGKTYLYYIGWNVRDTVPYHNSVGLAVSDDSGVSFRKAFSGPIMDRTAEEPYFCATTCVRVESGIWRNWYLSCTGWDALDGKMEPRYHLKYAESKDGVTWDRKGIVAIDFSSPDEGAIARATVVQDGTTYKMWYCYRSHDGYRSDPSKSYSIGYAESLDGVVWRRFDEGPVVKKSGIGWDSEMVAYPEVIDTRWGRYMFYNGNGFGRSGFGYATWKHS